MCFKREYDKLLHRFHFNLNFILFLGIIAKWAHVDISECVIREHKTGGIILQGHRFSR